MSICLRWTIAFGLMATVLGTTAFRPVAQVPVVTISIDAGADRHKIDPRIYGLAYATPAQLKDLRSPSNRMGGNNTSRYNWKLNADNRGNDWYFESIGESSSVAGERGDTFIANTRAGGAEPLVTIPMVDWIARVGPGREKLLSFSVAKYGRQQKTDPYMSEAGNGNKPDGKPVTGNDPADANVRNSVAFQQDWVRHIVAKHGKADGGGLRYYILDNEPGIWHGTHRDVTPVGIKAEALRDRILSYAAAIKAVDPGALVVAPEEWGWTGYIYSPYDHWYGGAHGWANLPEHSGVQGGRDFMPWLLDQLHQNNVKTGKRLVDIFTAHIYPQGGEFGNDTSPAMQDRRNRSTRALWDPNYKDETWINEKIHLIPRLKDWVNQNYPGTPIGITEYNWGAEGHINGATAQADVFGVFGREGLDLANRWTTPATGTPVYNSIKLYRNYDDKGSEFGNTSIRAAAPEPDKLSAFAAVRSSDRALTVMIINKVRASSTVTLELANFRPSLKAQVWQLTSTNKIEHLAELNLGGGRIHALVPAQSITLFVVPASNR